MFAFYLWLRYEPQQLNPSVCAKDWQSKIEYSPVFSDDIYDYRYVVIPRELVEFIPNDRTLTEAEWRQIGITQSFGWEHFEKHFSEHHILMFRRAKYTDSKTGRVPAHVTAVRFTFYAFGFLIYIFHLEYISIKSKFTFRLSAGRTESCEES